MSQWVDNNNSQFVEDNQLQWFSEAVTTYSGIIDLNSSIEAIPAVNLGAFLRSFTQSYTDMSSNIDPIPPANLPSSLQGWDTKNLQSLVNSVPPINLNAILNVIEVRNLLGSIVGEWWHDSSDLNATIPKIFLRVTTDLPASVYGTSLVGNFLQAFITF